MFVSPLYYADPMGAIVGRNIKTWKVPYAGNKSIGGTLAVIMTAFANLLYFTGCSWEDALVTATLIGIIELYSGEWDNVCISGGLAIRFLMLHAEPGFLSQKVEFLKAQVENVDSFTLHISLLLLGFALVLLLSISKVMPKYLARKALHMGTGTLCVIAYD